MSEPAPSSRATLTAAGLSSPTRLLGVLIQRSNCLVVVERGALMPDLQRERALRGAGELQPNSNLGNGQMLSADLLLQPSVELSESNAAGLAGVIGGRVGGATSDMIGAVAGRTQVRRAQTALVVVDVRTGVQIASSERTGTRADFQLAAGGISDGVPGGIAAYQSTMQGRVIAASFEDALTALLLELKRDARFPTSSVATAHADAPPVAGGASTWAPGDVLRPKIDGVSLHAGDDERSPQRATLTRQDDLVFLGTLRSGFALVQSVRGEGWVRALLLGKR